MNRRPTILPSLITLALCCTLAVAAFAQAGRFAVQLGAFPTRAEADEKVTQLKAQDISAYIVKTNVPGKGLFYRVRLGNFPTRAAAEQSGQKLKAQGAVAEYYIAAYEAPEPEAPVNAANNAPKALPVAPAPLKEPAKELAKPQPKTVTLTPTATTTTKPPASTAGTGAPAANSAGNTPAIGTSTNAPVIPPPATPASNPAGAAAVPRSAGYTRYTDQAAGYSFEHPQYWVGCTLNANEMQSQKVSAGAMFKSNEDAAFLNAIWNKLDQANSPDHDNDMIVDLILKSMATGNGTQNMQALSRRVVNEGQQIKTFLDLKAAFQVPNQPAPLDFIGKGVIIRANKGILLVVAFYSKDAAQAVAMTAEHIVQTARTPE
jgi:hypothetical protein